MRAPPPARPPGRSGVARALGAGLAAGAIVGLVDGARAAVALELDLRGGLAAAGLVAAVDAVIGFGAAVVALALGAVARWGRRVDPPASRFVPALLLLGSATASVAVAAFAVTLDRRNRFLAGGLAALATVACALGSMLVAPALARVLTFARASSPERGQGAAGDWRREPVLWLSLPFVLGLGAVMVAVAVTRGHAPFVSPASQRIARQVAYVGAMLPALLILTERLPLRLRWGLVLPAALVTYIGAAVILVVRTWSSDLRFLPWTDVCAATALVLVAVGLAVAFARRRSGRPRVWLGTVAFGLVGAVLVTIAASESEPARKASARAGLVGPVLAAARRASDLDRDGYARLFGGGDCDDRDPTVHPGVLDFPDDGIDQDCDGKDASVSALVPPAFAAVPASVPVDLNLVLITIDTVRADHLSCYGYARLTSPAIDELAKQGALFVNGWAHAPSTRYSMPAIATGRWPSAITWDESIWWPRLGRSMRTLAEALKEQGYLTAAFYSFEYFSLNDRRGFERGVDEYRADRASLHQSVNGPMESHGSSSREMADDAIAFFDAHQKQKFFLWVHFYDPHLSYEPHGEVPSFGTRREDLYDGEIRFTDLHVGRLLARLRALGLWDRTAIVVTGDHGEGFGEHGVTEHGFDLYAAQTKVPFIVRVPGLTPRRVTAPAGHVDIAPTLLNLARAPAATDGRAFLGRSLVPELDGRAPAPAPAVFQEVTSERGKKRGLVTEDLHLIWNWTPENTTECYDLRRDPSEIHDVWGRRSGASGCAALKVTLQGLVSALSVPPDVAARLKASVFAPGVPAPRSAVALDATLGDAVTVAGYTLSSPEVHAGGEVEVTLSFESRKPVAGGWRFFFHLMGPAGSFRNLDHVPVDGAYPIGSWRKGQRIVDRLKIAIPPGTPPGAYRLIVGLYRGNERMVVAPAAASDGNKAVRIATILVR